MIKKMIWLAACLLNACGGGNASTPTPGSAIEPVTQYGVVKTREIVGQLDPRVLGTSNGGYPSMVQLTVLSNGSIEESSVEHHDLRRVPEKLKMIALGEFPESVTEKYRTKYLAHRYTEHQIEVRTKDGQRCELGISERDTAFYSQCEILPQNLPKEVSLSVSNTFPMSKMIEAIHRTKPDEWYAIKVKSGAQTNQLQVTSHGEIKYRSIYVPAWLEIMHYP